MTIQHAPSLLEVLTKRRRFDARPFIVLGPLFCKTEHVVNVGSERHADRDAFNRFCTGTLIRDL